jgi:Fe-S oxidoreductase
MEQHELRNWEARCIQEEPPACQAGCPLGVDGRGFTAAIRTGNLKAARRILEKHIPLTGIVARLCEAPCQQYCLRKDHGESIALGRLERFCVEAIPGTPKILRLPPRSQKVVVLGGGPGCLTAAFDLAKKGYPVTLFHEEPGPGECLQDLGEEVLPADVLQEELARLTKLGVVFRPFSSLTKDDFSDAAAFYLGNDGARQLNKLKPFLPGSLNYRETIEISPDPDTFALPGQGWFSGGINADGKYRLITEVYRGRQAALSMDRFLQGASLTADRKTYAKGKTRLHTNTGTVIAAPCALPENEKIITEEQARKEAERCLDCQCLECVKHCSYLRDFGGYPKVYARRIYNNLAIVKGVHQANTMINSCSLCRQCEEFCPNDFSMADLCLSTRQTMVREGRMPPSAHWFALEEMRSAHKDTALLEHAAGTRQSKWLFFPGCQLAGIRPKQTLRLYTHLLALEKETGIWLDCCAAPAQWAGREQEYQEYAQEFRNTWQGMGNPQIVTACATCLSMLNKMLPGTPAVSAWTVLADTRLPETVKDAPKILAISDPCTARDDRKTQAAIRDIVRRLNCTVHPLTMAGKLTECCGFGGLMDNANPEISRQVARDRVRQTDAEILTYCAMCRDQLAKTGHPISHILDLLFPDIAHPAQEPPQTLSARRAHRRQLKAELLCRYAPRNRLQKEPWETICLEIPENVAALMEERRILIDDVKQVLHAVSKKKAFCFRHGEKNRFLAMAVLGEVGFWVEYVPGNDRFTISKCWSHRMKIVRTGV